MWNFVKKGRANKLCLITIGFTIVLFFIIPQVCHNTFVATIENENDAPVTFAVRAYTLTGDGSYNITTMGATAADDLTIYVENGLKNVELTGSRTGAGYTRIVFNGTATVTLNKITITNNDTAQPFIQAGAGTNETATIMIQGANSITNTSSNYPLISASGATNLVVRGSSADPRASSLTVSGYTVGVGSYLDNTGNITVSDLSWTHNSRLEVGIGTKQGNTKDITINNILLKANNEIYTAIGTFNGQTGNIRATNIDVNSTSTLNVGVGVYCNNAASLSAVANSITASDITLTATGFVNNGIGCYHYAGPLAKVTSFIDVNRLTINSGSLIDAGIGAANTSDISTNCVAGNITARNSVIKAESFIRTGIGGWRSNIADVNAENVKISSKEYIQVGIGGLLGLTANVTANGAEISAGIDSEYNRVAVGAYRSGGAQNIYLRGTIDIFGYSSAIGFAVEGGFDMDIAKYGLIYVDSANIKQVFGNKIIASPTISQIPKNTGGEPLNYYLISGSQPLQEVVEPYQSYPGYTYSANPSTNSNTLFNSQMGIFLPDRFTSFSLVPANGAVVYPSITDISLTFPRNIQFNPNVSDGFQVYKVGSATPIPQNTPTITDNHLTLYFAQPLDENTTYTIVAAKGAVQDTAIGYIRNTAISANEYTFSTRTFGSLHLFFPITLPFGETEITPFAQIIPVNLTEQTPLGVIDDREIKGPWKLGVQLKEAPHNSLYNSYLPEALLFRKDNVFHTLSDETLYIYEFKNNNDNLFPVSDTWYKAEDEGLFIKVTPQVRKGHYSATLLWILEDAP